MVWNTFSLFPDILRFFSQFQSILFDFIMILCIMTKKKKGFLIPDSNRVSLRRNENCQLSKKKKKKREREREISPTQK